MHNSKNSWDQHYLNNKSILHYPDENLVRMISSVLDKLPKNNIKGFDLGCGCGRHLPLLIKNNISVIAGLDMSLNALKICKQNNAGIFIQSMNDNIPIKSKIFDLGICWGGLHYNTKENLKQQIKEVIRILKIDGIFLGTLRTDRDTILKKGKNLGNNVWITNNKDIANSITSFYSEEELNSILANFRKVEYGIMERSPLGKINQKISHWYFKAIK